MATRDLGTRDDAGRPLGQELVGRDTELSTVGDRLSAGRRVVTVLGVAGAGKTSVLTAAAQAATDGGWVVLRVQGRPTETRIGFAVLLDLLDSEVEADPGTTALAAALREHVVGGAAGRTPDPLWVRRTLHQWLLGLAQERDLLVLVDDVQWVDAASWSVLAFVANRLRPTQVSFLLASRGDTSPVGLDDQPVVHLPPLALPEAALLLERSGPSLDPLVRASVMERAAGNPLALLELGRSSASVAVGSPMSVHHSVPASVEAAFAADLSSLPASTRRLLLLVAAGCDDLVMLSRAAEPSGGVVGALEPAERAGLVRVLGKQVQFRHPLIGSTVQALASAAGRREAHAVLAEVYADDEDRRVWHRAAATDSLDDDVAASLVASADRLWMRGAQQEASDAMVRAAELTVDRDLRDERILAAVSMSPAVGHVHTMAMLGDHLRSRSTHPLVRARAAQLHAYALAQTMDQSSARDLLEQALGEVIELDHESGWASLTTLATLTYRTGRGRDVLAHWLDRYEAITPHDIDEQPLNAAARAWIVAALEPMAGSADLHRLLATAPDRPAGDLPPQTLVAYDTLLGGTAWLLDQHQTGLRRLARASELAQRSGASQQVAQPVMALGQVQFDLGMYDDADRSGRLLVDIGEAQGLSYYRTVGRELRARVAAVRGDARGALDELDSLAAGIEPGQTASLGASVAVGRAHALVALLDHEGAYLALRSLFGDDGAPRHPHLSYLALGDLVAAAVRVGRVSDVTSVVRSVERQLSDHPGDRMARVLARARAQLADDADAGAMFELAVSERGAPTWPFEWGNAQLEHGVWLRRQRRSTDAQRALHEARQIFAWLGATAWVAAAEAELRAAGVRLEDAGGRSSGWEHLTAQEREIVLLAATGLSNKQIGQTLFLSPRTVGAHLYHAFPKLGVTSRTQLRDVVDLLQDG